MYKKNEIVAILFFSLLPFTSVFSINQYITLSLTGMVGAAFIMFLFKKKLWISILLKRKIFICILAFIFFMTLINGIATGAIFDSDRVMHVVARLMFPLMLLGGAILIYSIYNVLAMDAALKMGIFIALAVCFIDFLELYGMSNYVLPRVELETMYPTLGIFFRIRGPAEEPGHLAAYFAASIPILLQIKNKIRLGDYILVFFVYIVTFSFAYLIWVAIFIATYFFLKSFDSRNKLRNITLSVLIPLVLVGIVYAVSETFSEYIPILNKLSSSSLDDRVQSLNLLSFIEEPNHILFGIGPGGYKEFGLMQPINFILSSYVETGLLGVLFISLLFFYCLTLLMLNNMYFLAAGLVAYLIFYNSISNYWFPFYILPMLYFCLLPALKNFVLSQSKIPRGGPCATGRGSFR